VRDLTASNTIRTDQTQPRRLLDDLAYAPPVLRLTLGDWLVTFVLVLVLLLALPRLWTRIEPFSPAPDYRIPYALSEDYWHFERYARATASAGKAFVLGDSVLWGRYVQPDQTLVHYLNERTGADDFANLAVNGMHPLALAGLIEHHGRPITNSQVLLHCNMLWFSSPRHDLQAAGDVTFNHPDLVPQFRPWIPAYRASLDDRLGVVAGRHLPSSKWAEHLRLQYFDGLSIPAWSLEHPYENPVEQVLAGARASALQPSSAADAAAVRPAAEPLDAEWVDLDASLQWRSLLRSVEILRHRGNEVFVLIGPFNETMLASHAAEELQALQRAMAERLRSKGVACWIGPAQRGGHFADASHLLPVGYEALARQLLEQERFQRFVQGNRHLTNSRPSAMMPMPTADGAVGTSVAGAPAEPGLTFIAAGAAGDSSPARRPGRSRLR